MKLQFTTLRIPACSLAAGLAALAAVTPARADYSDTIMSFHPVAYWRLNEKPAQDTATNAGTAGALGNGFYLGMSSMLHPASGALVGSTDTAASFDASNPSLVQVPYFPGLSLQPPFTVEAWVKPAVTTGTTTPLSCAGVESPSSGWMIQQVTATGWSFKMYNQNGATASLNITATNPIVAGSWHHVVAVYDGTNASMYVNGTQLASGVPTGYVPDVGAPLTIGARSDQGSRWNGTIDEVAIYTNALATSDIQAHYQNGISPTPSQAYDQLVRAQNPLCYYRLNEPVWTPGVGPIVANSGSWGTTAAGTGNAGTMFVPGVPYGGFGNNSGACLFDGVSGTLEVPGQYLVTNCFTLTCWFKRNSDERLYGIWYQDAENAYGAKTGYGFGRNTNDSTGATTPANNLRYYWNNAQGQFGNSTRGFAVPDNQWVFGALVITPTNGVLYQNNLSEAFTGSNAVHDFSQAPMVLGNDRSTGGRFFRGQMSEVALFDQALTPAQIRQIYNAANVPPFIITQPKAPTGAVYEGMSLSFNMTADGGGTLSYQWTKDGSAISGATTNSYALSNVTTNDSGAYAVVVTNDFGAVTSSVVRLTVVAGPPMIVQQPQPAVRYVGGTASFSVQAGGSLPFSYQWNFNSTPIPGATNAICVIPGVTTNNVGNYSVRVTNPQGYTNSSSVALTLLPATNYVAEVVATGPVAYWRFNETNGTTAYDYFGGYHGTTASTLTNGVPGPQPPDYLGVESTNTAYQFRGAAEVGAPSSLKNLNTNAFSVMAWVRINVANAYAVIVDKGDNLWRLDAGSGSNIRFMTVGATRPNITLSGTRYVGDGLWHQAVAVYDGFAQYIYVDGTLDASTPATGSIAVNDFPITVGGQEPVAGGGGWHFNGDIDEVALYSRALSAAEIRSLYQIAVSGPTAPQIVSQPSSNSVFAGQAARFSVMATGGNLSYQWQRGGTNLPGATAATLDIPSAYYTDAGVYSVLISNSLGTTNSQPATLSVMAPPLFANLTNELVLHLKFEGDYHDSSGRGNNGTAVGTPTFVPGVIGSSALRYNSNTNGVYNYVTLGTPADLQFGVDVNFSVACWVKLPAGAQPGDLPFLCNAYGSLGNFGYTFAPSWAGGWAWSLQDVYTTTLTTTGPANSINDGNWHHLVYTFERAGLATTYLDGVPVSSRSISTLSTIDSGYTVNVGQDASGTYTGSGQADVSLDDLGVWRRALSSAEAQSVYLVGHNSGQSFDVYGPVALTLNPCPGGFELIWQAGTLEAADEVNGSYAPVARASAPYYKVTPAEARKFYRVKL